MNSDLIVMTFPRQEEARRTQQALEMMQGRHVLGLENAALVTRDRAGRTAVHQRRELTASPCSPRSCLPALFASVIFAGSPDGGTGPRTNVSLDDLFVAEVVRGLRPGGSALLVYVPSDAVVDTRRLLDALALFQGRLHHTTLPAVSEEAVLEWAWRP